METQVVGLAFCSKAWTLTNFYMQRHDNMHQQAIDASDLV